MIFLEILIYFLVALSLSIDAFSLSVSIGLTIPPIKSRILLVLFVGIFHFIMPLLGSSIGITFFQNNDISKYLPSFVFLVLAMDLYLNKEDEEFSLFLNLGMILLIAFTVSIDSFSVGIALGVSSSSIILSSVVISITSAIFTYLGLMIGSFFQQTYQKKAKSIGVLLLLGLAIKFLFFQN